MLRGERVELYMPRRLQEVWLQEVYGRCGEKDDGGSAIWLETDTASYPAGSPPFFAGVDCLLGGCGIMANLSLRENLLLPFLYGGDRKALIAAEQRVEQVAEELQIASLLDAKAEERGSLVHVLVGLGRCLLHAPSVIIAQEVHAGVPPERMRWFQGLWAAMMSRLGAGLLYLCSGDHPDWGLAFDRSLSLQAVARRP